MSSVIDELVGDGVTVNSDYVGKRVDDWAFRVSDLYQDVTSWVPDLVADQLRSVEMGEPLMHAHGVAAIRLPVLRIRDAEGELAEIVPRGLWVIGTNGRLTMFSRNGQFVIVDRADPFAPSRWEISPALSRSDARWLSRDTFRQAIE